jgi:MoxR-like ATPase
MTMESAPLEQLDIREINKRVQKESVFIQDLRREIGKVIVGQEEMVDRLMVGLLANGHLLLEGVPGLAKTLTVRTLAQAIDCSFKRIQFTPDLLPADLTGTMIFNPKDGSFTPRQGPLFANLVLADEINRAPAKVQSALLEAMQERQVTIGDATYKLPDPFLVLATQNPIEQEGTYQLPEAQVDRFMLKVVVTYPTKQDEREMLSRHGSGQPPAPSKVATPQQILSARKVALAIYMDDKVKSYIVELVFATRDPENYGLKNLKGLIQYGASPRATLALGQSARAFAFLQGRGYVTPEDVKTIGLDILRHRVLVSYEAEAEGISSEEIIRHVFDAVEVP